MPRYEFSEGTSNKFWEIKLDGTSFTTTYGKIGSAGQTTIKTYKTPAQAKTEYDKLIAEKTKKGYQLVGGTGGASAKPAAADDDDDDDDDGGDDDDGDDDKPAAKARPAAAGATSGGGGKPGERYFEFVEGTSAKFWAISIDGSAVNTRYGKIGTAGQTTRKELDGPAAAFKEHDKLVAEKTRKGYTESTSTGGGGAESKRNAELENAIIADPYDQETYSVYADWLQSQGDPRGELIALQIGGKDKAARALLDKHADYFLGPLAAHQKTYDGDLSNNAVSHTKAWVAENQQAFLWKFGFIHRVRLAHDSYADDEFEGKLADVLELVLRHPSGRFITEMSFNSNGDPNENNLQDLLDILARKAPPTLRKITIGDNVDQISWYNVGNLGKLWAAVPNLTTLYIEAGSFTLGTIDAPNLRRAVFKTGGLSKASGKSIATASWPNIELLDIYYGDDSYGGDCTLKEVQPLLDRRDLTSLTHLGLKNSMFTDELCQVLGDAPVIKQLKELDLSMGCMTDAGAAALAAWKHAFSHLEALDVSDNYLTPEGEKVVKGLARKVITGKQRADDDPEYRHPSLGE